MVNSLRGRAGSRDTGFMEITIPRNGMNFGWVGCVTNSDIIEALIPMCVTANTHPRISNVVLTLLWYR